MDCRAFRKHHLAYLDNTLPGDLLVSAECHVIECAACARHDTAVRRSLLLARNLPPIEPSADFAARLEARLRAECAGGRAGVTAGRRESWARGWEYGGDLAGSALLSRAFASRTRAAALTAGLLVATFAAGNSFREDGEPTELRHPPVIATLPEVEPDQMFGASDLVTPASTGISVWPAALLADQVPAQLVGAHFQLTSYGR